jgi:hypothetical protein
LSTNAPLDDVVVIAVADVAVEVVVEVVEGSAFVGLGVDCCWADVGIVVGFWDTKGFKQLPFWQHNPQ